MLNRRSFLTALAASLPLRAQRPAAAATVRVDDEIGTINPLIYGHFVEHIGTVVYDGIWVGPDSKIPNVDGYRTDTLEALQRIRPTVFRWPGGCFADTYHWEDGVGPKRRREVNHWWRRDEPNTFGSHEFIEWARRLSAEPYLSVNVGTGTVEEALNWLAYCNGTEKSGYADLRRQHGREEPYGIKWWGIGNENWGCGGGFTPEEYAQRFRQYAIYFKRFGLTQGLQLVAAGHNTPGWIAKCLQATGAGLPYVDHISFHRYFRRGHSTDFTDDQYTDLMLDVGVLEKLIRDSIQAIKQAEGPRAQMRVFGPLNPKPIGLVIDEWGAWHSDPVIDNGFRQRGVLREAIFAAATLNMFHDHADRVTMTNIAQIANCLHSLILTDGEKMVLTPTFHVYEMYRQHQGAVALKATLETSPLMSREGRDRASVSVSASKSGDSLLVTVVNMDPAEAVDMTVKLDGAKAAQASARFLTGGSVRAENTFDEPKAAVPKRAEAGIEGGSLRLELPAGSVGAVEVALG